MSVWGAIRAILSWGTATANEDGDGRVQVECARGEPRENCEQLGLPGFYGVLAAAEEVVVLRRDDGGLIIAVPTHRPDGTSGMGGPTYPEGAAQKYDRGIIGRTSNGSLGLRFRIRGDELRITGASAIVLDGTTKVVLDGDDVLANAAFAMHTHSGVTAGGAITGPASVGIGSPIGDCQSSATKVTAA